MSEHYYCARPRRADGTDRLGTSGVITRDTLSGLDKALSSRDSIRDRHGWNLYRVRPGSGGWKFLGTRY